MEDIQETVVEEASVDVEQQSSEVSTSETDVNTEVVAPTTEEPKFGEALKAELSRREAQIEKKYKEQYGDYDSIKSHTKYLERRAKQEGFTDVESYVKAIDDFDQQQLVEQEASRYGVPEEFIRQELQPLKSELDSLKAEREQFKEAEVHRQIESEVAELAKNNPDFDGMKDEVFSFAIQNNIKLEHAYKLLTYDSRIESATKAKEQEVLAKLTGRDSKQVLSSIDSPNTMTLNPADMTSAEIRSISERVQRGERITF